MSYEIQEGYPKLHNVAKEDSALAEQYKSKFNEVNADIVGAQALIDDDPTSENYNGDLVLNADKLNAICDSLDDLQPTFINAKETLAEWMTNFSKEITEYDSTETYNYGEVVTYQDTSETIQSNAYSVPVPAGAKMCNLQKISGKSLVWNQLVNGYTIMDTAVLGIVRRSPDVRGVHYVGTSTQSTTFTGTRAFPSVNGHKYLVEARGTNLPTDVYPRTAYYARTPTNPNIITATSDVTNNNIGLYIPSGTSIDTDVWFNFHDLTQMFGAGNEPATVEEFKAMFPNDYYAYNTGEVIHADIDKVVEQGVNLWDEEWEFGGLNLTTGEKVSNDHRLRSKNYIPIDPEYQYRITIDVTMTGYSSWIIYNVYDSKYNFISSIPDLSSLPNNARYLLFCTSDNWGVSHNYEGGFILSKGSTATPYHPYRHNEYPIPNAIRNLEGYGWSAGNVYNEVDFERKKFIKRVGRVDLGSLNWSRGTSSESGKYYMTSNGIASTVAIPPNNNTVSNLVCSNYTATTYNNVYAKTIGISIGSSGSLGVYDENLQVAQEFKSAMSGVYLYYELATPIETDISDILEPFEVEAGGTITFHNSNGDGYGIPVPSKIKFGHGINGTFICIDKNVTGAFNPSKWLMLTPSDLGFDLTDAEVINNNGLVEIYLNDEMIAQVIPNLIYLNDENDAQNGMVYLVQVDGNKYQLRYKDNSGNVNIINNETNASISTYKNSSIQTELNRLKEFMERSD